MTTDQNKQTDMTPRERYLRIARFEPVDRIANIEGRVHELQYHLWREAGDAGDLEFHDADAYRAYFGIEPKPEVYRGLDYRPRPGVKHDTAMMYLLNGVARDRSLVDTWPTPHEDRPWWVAVDPWGGVKFVAPNRDEMDEWANSAYHQLQGGVPNRRVWDEIRDRFEPCRERLGEDWDEKVARWKDRDTPLILEVPSIGSLKHAMGYETFCMTLYDDPGLIDEILTRQMDLAIALLDLARDDVAFDAIWFWEDLAYRNGPLFAPSQFDEIVAPHYRRLIEHYRDVHGGDLIMLDSDGDIRKLIPSWLACGVNHIWPMEVFANMDVVALRAEYGQAFSMRGGVDKFCVRAGKEAIDRELDRVFPVVQEGGFIPHLDHMMPTATFENYCYYIERKKKMLDSV